MKIPLKWRVAVVVLIGPAMAMMDATIVSVILPQLQQTFHTDFETINWVASAYFLAEAAIIPIVGYLSDHLGSKRVFLAAMALFTASSLLCAIAPTKEALITFRALQGIGGGALIPLYYTICYRMFAPNERSKLVSVVGIPLLLVPAFGPTIGGYLTVNFSWNFVFLINVPIGIITLLLCFWVLPGRASDGGDVPQTKVDWKNFDILGLLSSVAGVTTLVYGISEAGAKGWGDATVLSSLLVGTIILAAFVVVELQRSDPVLDLRLFTNPTFAISNILLWLTLGLFLGGLFLLPLFFENVQGSTVLVAGQSLIGQGIGIALGVSIAGTFYNRLGPRPLAVCGLLLLVSGTYALTQINADTTAQSLQVWLILRGLGVGFAYQPAQTLALSIVSNRGMARASSLISTTRQMASAAAVAALTTYLTMQTAAHGVGRPAIALGMADTFWLILIISAACILLALVMGNDPALVALKQRAAAPGAVASREAQGTILETPMVQTKSIPDMISTVTARGEETQGTVPATPMVQTGNIPNVISTVTAGIGEIMGPDILLWHYPADNVLSGSLLVVESNHFCVLKLHGQILNVYEAGQYRVPTPAHPFSDTMQLAFDGKPISSLHEALYINRAKLPVTTSGVALSRDMAEVDYRVDYFIQVVSREDAAKLVEHMPYHSHTLNVQEISAYLGPFIGQVINQQVQTISLRQIQELQLPSLSQWVHQSLQEFLSSYGITVSVGKVLVGPRDEHMKALISLMAFGLKELDAVRYYTDMQKNEAQILQKERYQESRREMHITWQKTLERYANEIAAIQAELESTRVNLGSHIDTQYTYLSARLQELLNAVNSQLQASTPVLEIASLPDSWMAGETQQFMVPGRNESTVTGKRSL